MFTRLREQETHDAVKESIIVIPPSLLMNDVHTPKVHLLMPKTTMYVATRTRTCHETNIIKCLFKFTISGIFSELYVCGLDLVQINLLISLIILA